MKLRQKHQPHLIAGIFISAYLISRLYNLLAVPIFTDEAIYIRWTQIFKANIHQPFISLTDGKQPLLVWLGMPLLKVIHNPLLGLRLVSVLAGLVTMFGIYLLTNELFNSKKLALTATFLYIIYPLTLVYDRLALYESLLATFAIWSLYAEVLLVRRRAIWTAILTAVILGGGLLTKSSAFFFIYLIPFSLLLFNFKSSSRKKDAVRWVLLVSIAVVGAVACYSTLRLSPNYHYIADKNNTFIYPFHEWVKHPFEYVFTNAHLLVRMLVEYMTVPLLVLSGAALFVKRKLARENALLLAWFIMPIAALAFFGKTSFLTPRYMVFMTIPLLILASQTIRALLDKIKPVYLALLVVGVLIAPMVYKDYFIVTNFSKAQLPKEDHKQLIAGYPGGAGVNETVRYLTARAQKGNIYVGTEGVFGLMPDSLQDYFDGKNHITVTGYWPIESQPPAEVLAAAKTMPTYFIFYAPCPLCGGGGTAPKSWPLKEIFQIQRLDKSYYTLYQVIPE